MAYVVINNNEIDADSPITASLVSRIRDNPLEVSRGAPTALAAGEGVAVDYDFGSGPQTAIITDELSTDRSLTPDGLGGVKWGTVDRGGGVLAGGIGLPGGSPTYLRSTTPAETLLGLTAAAISDGIGGHGLKAIQAVNRAHLRSCIWSASALRLQLWVDQGAGVLVMLKENVYPGTGLVGMQSIEMSLPLVAGYTYFHRVQGAGAVRAYHELGIWW